MCSSINADNIFPVSFSYQSIIIILSKRFLLLVIFTLLRLHEELLETREAQSTRKTETRNESEEKQKIN